jgi:hypothetical protein
VSSKKRYSGGNESGSAILKYLKLKGQYRTDPYGRLVVEKEVVK